MYSTLADMSLWAELNSLIASAAAAAAAALVVKKIISGAGARNANRPVCHAYRLRARYFLLSQCL